MIADQRGSLIVSLPLIFLLLILVVSVVKVTQLVTVGDVILHRATTLAARSAANQFYLVGVAGEETGEDEQAAVEVYPTISPIDARYAFERILQSNLKLDGNLNPQAGSSLEGSLRYSLLVCTGQEMENILFTFDGGELGVESIPFSGFPQWFVVENIPVIFSEPGVFVVVEGTVKPILGKPNSIKQVAKASVKFIHGQWFATSS